MGALTNRRLASLAHPVRRAALEQIATGPSSPEAIARENDLPLGVVAYHVRTLATAGLISLDHTEQARGATRHVYRLAAVNGLADDISDLAAGLEGLAIALTTPATGRSGTATSGDRS
jgi:predicted transcriptional regulator